MQNILILNAHIIDGSGNPAFEADVRIADGRITEIGKLEKKDAEGHIDAGGYSLAPGFIDMHSHADFSLPILATADSLLFQGVTTAVIGQCGLSPAPLVSETRGSVIAALSGFFGDTARSIPWEKWTSFSDYLGYLSAEGISINVIPFVGQGIIRASVMGFEEGRADSAQMTRMQREVSRALDQGAFGLSTGLIYPPGAFTSTDELIELTRVVGERNRFYFSHIRGEAETLLDAVAEAIRIGRETGASVQISHFKAAVMENWDKSQKALDLIRRAQLEGLDVSADLYPYTAGSTSMATLLPQWAHVGGPEKTISHLKDPDTRDRLKTDMQTTGFARGVEWDKVLITSSPLHTGYEGHNIAEMASETGRTGYDWLFDALLETHLDMHMAFFGMSEENRRNELKYPGMMIGTDGFGMAASGAMAKGVPHPRSYGTFPRVLARYVRQLKVLTLEDAVHRMTGLPAAKLRLHDRGLIKPGKAADLVLFDPDTIADTATYEKPHQYARGIWHVFVNGEAVIKETAHTGLRPGRVLEST